MTQGGFASPRREREALLEGEDKIEASHTYHSRHQDRISPEKGRSMTSFLHYDTWDPHGRLGHKGLGRALPFWALGT
jgi:hypothetical protein